MDWGSLIGAAASYIIPEIMDSLDGSDYSNKYIEKSLKRLNMVSKEGYGADVVSDMKADVNRTMGAEDSAGRSSTTQRLMRDNTPVQIREQILRDLSRSMAGQRQSALTGIDVKNEEAKLNALRSLMGGSVSATQDTGWSELQGGLLGSIFANMINKNSSSGNTTDYFNTQSIADSNKYQYDPYKKDYYGYSKIGQFGDL